MADRRIVRLLLLAIVVGYISAKKPGRPLPSAAKGSQRPSTSNAAASSSRSRRPPTAAASAAAESSRKPVPRRPVEDIGDNVSDEEEEEGDPISEEEEEEEILPKRKSSHKSSFATTAGARRSPPGATAAKRRTPPPVVRRQPPPTTTRQRPPPVDRRRRRAPNDVEEEMYEEEEEYDEPPLYPPPHRPNHLKRSAAAGQRRGPPPPPSRGGRMVPYTQVRKPTFASALTQSLAAVGKALPDMKEKAVSGLQTARSATGSLTSNLYREIKGLTSSELEQVLLKATRPDDQSSKGKHVERLIGLTYQIPVSYDVYNALLRKIWSKMAEPDWRTNLKAVYILHRFSADGSPAHAASLKARLREMRRMNDPKRKNTKYFSSKVLLAGRKGNDPSVEVFRAFVGRYAHYVLLRTQCFSGMFEEIAQKPGSSTKKDNNLRKEHLDAAAMLLKAALECQLKSGEECENTAIGMERVCADMMAMSSAVATALNRAIGKKKSSSASPKLIREWCLFYKDELLPKTKGLIKKTTGKLDAYGLFLPSRMGASIAQDVLEQGLNVEESPEASIEEAADDAKEDKEEEAVKPALVEKTKSRSPRPSVTTKARVDEEVDEEGDEEEEEEEKVDIQQRSNKKLDEEDDRVGKEADIDEEYEYEDEEEFYDEE